MAPPTLTTPRLPRLDSLSRNNTARAGRVRFGDGYAQRQKRGPADLSQALAWPPMTEAQAQTLVTFFEARAGSQAFYYDLGGGRGLELWTCPNWTETEPVARLCERFRNLPSRAGYHRCLRC